MKRIHIGSFLAGASLLFVGLIIGQTGGVTPNRNEHLVMSVLWYQQSAEARALYYQAFNIARQRVDEDLARNKSEKRRAIVVDIDETLLNNSPHSVKLIKENQVFPYAWSDWVNRAEADALPGSAEFLNYAVSKGYDIYYVSNRLAGTEQEGTMKNLQAKGFPQVTNDHMMLKEKESSKDSRRLRIGKSHDIVLLIGDNLNDLATSFEQKSVTDRAAEAERLQEEFGRRFIVLPNPMYGDWESAVYGYRHGLSDAQQDELRKAALRSF